MFSQTWAFRLSKLYPYLSRLGCNPILARTGQPPNVLFQIMNQIQLRKPRKSRTKANLWVRINPLLLALQVSRQPLETKIPFSLFFRILPLFAALAALVNHCFLVYPFYINRLCRNTFGSQFSLTNYFFIQVPHVGVTTPRNGRRQPPLQHRMVCYLIGTLLFFSKLYLFIAFCIALILMLRSVDYHPHNQQTSRDTFNCSSWWAHVTLSWPYWLKNFTATAYHRAQTSEGELGRFNHCNFVRIILIWSPFRNKFWRSPTSFC